ncbi:MAG: UDP-2,3-diacylglucosamine diphosphatase [Thermodesulfobacteriota bacterium]
MTTLIVSDVHLGSSFNRAKDLTSFIKSVDFGKLIILGDLFDRPDFKKLNEDEWTFLNVLNKISEIKEVIWVEGNHDEMLNKSIPSMFNIRAVKEYDWTINGKKLLAIHGHQFDDYTLKKNYLAKFASTIYKGLRSIDEILDRDIFHPMCYNNKSWQRVSETVNIRALEYGKKNKADFVFCGHTHRATNVAKNGVEYFNTGCWNDRYCHYVLIDDQRVTLNKFTKPVKSIESSAPRLRLRPAL